MKPSLGKTITGGFVGTLLMTLILYKVAPMMGMPKMDLAESLGAMLGIGWILGLMMHFINGVIIFPLLYAYLLYRLLPGAPAVKGLLVGLALWFVSQTVVTPMMGGGFFSAGMGGMMAAVGSLVNHLIYGVLLGAIAGRGKNPGMARQNPGLNTA